MDNKD